MGTAAPMPDSELRLQRPFWDAAVSIGIFPTTGLSRQRIWHWRVLSYGTCYEEIEQALMADLEQEAQTLWKKCQNIPVWPEMICLSYAFVSFMEDETCFRNLTGGDKSLREKLSIEKQVKPGYPKTFLWACEDDELAPVNNALEQAGVPHLMKLYPTGGHGCGLGTGTSAIGWTNEMLAFMA